MAVSRKRTLIVSGVAIAAIAAAMLLLVRRSGDTPEAAKPGTADVAALPAGVPPGTSEEEAGIPDEEPVADDGTKIPIAGPTVLATVNGRPITGVDLNPMFVDGETYHLNKKTVEAQLKRLVERELTAQEAERRELQRRPDVKNMLDLADEAFNETRSLNKAEEAAYAAFAKRQRLEFALLREERADSRSVLEDLYDSFYQHDPMKYEAIAAEERSPRDQRREVLDAMRKDFRAEIREETNRRRLAVVERLQSQSTVDIAIR